MKLEHIAIAVVSLESAITKYEKLLQVKCSHRETVASEGVAVAFFPCQGFHVELVQALDQQSPIAKFITRRGEGMHHLAFEVASLDTELERLKQEGITPLGAIRPGSRGSKICFIHPNQSAGVLWELIEYPKSSSC